MIHYKKNGPLWLILYLMTIFGFAPQALAEDALEEVVVTLFYNTTAPGVVLFLNKAKPKAKQGKVLLVNASQVFEKGDPKNFIPDAGIDRIADTLIGWQEEDKLSRIVDHAEMKKNDYNLSPSRYIHTSDASSRSGNVGTNMEQTVHMWLVDHEFIESVFYANEVDSSSAAVMNLALAA